MKTTDTQNTALACLCSHLGADIANARDLGYSHYGLPIWEIAGEEYALAETDADADAAWHESLDSYIAECITPELNKLDSLGSLSSYIKFDEEMWKRDARMDGRGHSLSHYDGAEIELAGDAFAYRVN